MKYLIAALALAAVASPAAAQTFSNPAPIVIPDASQTSSIIAVAGLTGHVTGLTVTLSGLSHSYSDDLVIGLVNQTLGQGIYLLSYAGGDNGVVNAMISFSDLAGGQLPQSFVDSSGIVSGAYLPSNFGSYAFTTYSTVGSLSGFNGTDPNGIWQLLIADTAPGDSGSLSGGWSLSFATAVPEAQTWLMMIGGFGLAGAAMRSKRRAATALAA